MIHQYKRPLKRELSEKDINTMRLIASVVSEHFNAPIEDLKDKSRKRKIVEPRQIAMYQIYKYTPASVGQIGDIFGFDHSTVTTSRQKVEDLSSVDKDFSETVTIIETKIKALI